MAVVQSVPVANLLCGPGQPLFWIAGPCVIESHDLTLQIARTLRETKPALSAAMADSLAISSHDVTLPVVPMFHVNAWGVPYAAAMVGPKLVLPGPGLDGKSLYELIVNERVTSLLGVPTVWTALLVSVVFGT